MASWQHAPYLELLNDPPIGSYKHKFEIFENPPEVHDGWIDLPNGPGLGVEIDSRFVG